LKTSTIELQNYDNGVDQIWPLGQVDRVFIIAQSEKCLYLIDQHAAHERILYDKLVKCHENVPSQQFLVPLFIDATPQEIVLIEDNRQTFLQLGVDIEQAGEEMLRIASLPVDIKDEEAESFVRDILKMISEMKTISGSDLRQSVLHYTACHGAIKAGELLNMRQMRTLILDLCNTEHPFTCPHGRPCMIEITSEELYKMFKRI
jgi:DNA mismatch repair protein MutL